MYIDAVVKSELLGFGRAEAYACLRQSLLETLLPLHSPRRDPSATAASQQHPSHAHHRSGSGHSHLSVAHDRRSSSSIGHTLHFLRRSEWKYVLEAAQSLPPVRVRWMEDLEVVPPLPACSDACQKQFLEALRGLQDCDSERLQRLLLALSSATRLAMLSLPHHLVDDSVILKVFGSDDGALCLRRRPNEFEVMLPRQGFASIGDLWTAIDQFIDQ